MNTVRSNLNMVTVFAVALSFMTSTVLAKDWVPVELPTDHSNVPKAPVDYGPWQTVLSSSVLYMGKPTHVAATPSQYDGATLIKLGSTSKSRFEGNRVMLHEFRKPHKDTIRYIRDGLLAFPGTIAFESLSKTQQLAYWFNLHNSIVLSKVTDIYPVTSIKKTFDASRKKSFIYARDFKWQGQMISLADIQHHVITHWKNPIVIYGFYLGAVGTPNIQQEAFTGANVRELLVESARNFINSVRGTRIPTKSQLRVSSYYATMAVAFPNFDEDVLKHINTYAKSKLRSRMAPVKTVKANLSDWHIADIYNGRSTSGGQIYAKVELFEPWDPRNAQHRGLNTDLPRHATLLLDARKKRIAPRGGTTVIEQVASAKPISDRKKVIDPAKKPVDKPDVENRI